MILIPLSESVTHCDLKKGGNHWVSAAVNCESGLNCALVKIWMWSCVTWCGFCSSSSTGVPQHRKRPAKLSHAWQLQSAVGWLNNSKFLPRTIWQPKAGVPRHKPSSNSFCKSERVRDKAAAPLHRQSELVTDKLKLCCVKVMTYLGGYRQSERDLKYCWYDIKSLHIPSFKSAAMANLPVS